MARTITCKDCRATQEVRRRDAKYCASCSFLRVVMYAAKRNRARRRCVACSDAFRVATHKDSGLCGKCTASVMDWGKARPCKWCKQVSPCPDSRVDICIVCLKNPSTQQAIIQRMMAQRAARKERNAQGDS